MKPQDAESEFRALLLARGTRLDELTAADGVRAMLAFYGEIRGDGLRFQKDEDMLLFQWGTYERNDAPTFVYNITRQLIFDGHEDDDIWQLQLSFYFDPNETLVALGAGNRWCRSLDDLHEFASFVSSHPATAALSHLRDRGKTLNYWSVG
jgi:hypothetical protein